MYMFYESTEINIRISHAIPSGLLFKLSSSVIVEVVSFSTYAPACEWVADIGHMLPRKYATRRWDQHYYGNLRPSIQNTRHWTHVHVSNRFSFLLVWLYDLSHFQRNRSLNASRS